MKLFPILIALGVTVLPSAVYARIDPQELELLTMVTNYTFHSICNDFNNPDPYFDESVSISAPGFDGGIRANLPENPGTIHIHCRLFEGSRLLF